MTSLFDYFKQYGAERWETLKIKPNKKMIEYKLARI